MYFMMHFKMYFSAVTWKVVNTSNSNLKLASSIPLSLSFSSVISVDVYVFMTIIAYWEVSWVHFLSHETSFNWRALLHFVLPRNVIAGVEFISRHSLQSPWISQLAPVRVPRRSQCSNTRENTGGTEAPLFSLIQHWCSVFTATKQRGKRLHCSQWPADRQQHGESAVTFEWPLEIPTPADVFIPLIESIWNDA